MKRWGMPLLVIGTLLVIGLYLGLAPVETPEHHPCDASAFGVAAGGHVPEQHKEECHEAARLELFVAALPLGAAVVAAVTSFVILRAASAAEKQAGDGDDREE